ncbi:MAG TPA: methylamine utilization protein [Burkholderiales bacterium]|jgi:plastocyanin|nr:methylamine utilization protein [Burkholderiales bacterium]
MPSLRLNKRHLFSAVLMSGVLISQAQAGLVLSHVTDKNGQSIADTVVFATSLEKLPPPLEAGATAIIEQEKTTFVPYVTAIRAGTAVRFPNRDSYGHHVKSFSAAKTFEVRIDGKKEAPTPITFDKAGEVALVCFFHDSMRGFIYVVDTPYFAKSDKEGNAVLSALPPGKYEVKAWAPSMIGAPLTQTVSVPADGSINVNFKFDFVPKPAPKPKAPPVDKPAYSY